MPLIRIWKNCWTERQRQISKTKRKWAVKTRCDDGLPGSIPAKLGLLTFLRLCATNSTKPLTWISSSEESTIWRQARWLSGYRYLPPGLTTEFSPHSSHGRRETKRTPASCALCSRLLFLCSDKTLAETNLARKGYTWLTQITLYHPGKSRQEPASRNWNIDHRELLAYWLASTDCSACSLI